MQWSPVVNPAPTPSLTPKALRTRAALLDAARTVIGQEGIQSATVMAICAEARIGRTSFYTYFSGPDDVVAALATETAMAIRNRFERSHGDRPRGYARLRACLAMLLNDAHTDAQTMLVLTALAAEVPQVATLLAAEIEAELAATDRDDSATRLALVAFLTRSTLAMIRAVAQGSIGSSDISPIIDALMRASGEDARDR